MIWMVTNLRTLFLRPRTLTPCHIDIFIELQNVNWFISKSSWRTHTRQKPHSLFNLIPKVMLDNFVLFCLSGVNEWIQHRYRIGDNSKRQGSPRQNTLGASEQRPPIGVQYLSYSQAGGKPCQRAIGLKKATRNIATPQNHMTIMSIFIGTVVSCDFTAWGPLP